MVFNWNCVYEVVDITVLIIPINMLQRVSVGTSSAETIRDSELH